MLTGEGSEQWVNDVCVTDAFGAPNGVARSIESPGEVTETYAKNKKVRPFMKMELADKYRFRALALDSFGGMTEETKAYVKDLARAAALRIDGTTAEAERFLARRIVFATVRQGARMILARDEPAVHPAELQVPAGGGPGEDERERVETEIELEEEEDKGGSSGTNNTSIRAMPFVHQYETIPLPEDEVEDEEKQEKGRQGQEVEMEDEGGSSGTNNTSIRAMPSIQTEQQTEKGSGSNMESRTLEQEFEETTGGGKKKGAGGAGGRERKKLAATEAIGPYGPKGGGGGTGRGRQPHGGSE